MDVIGADPQRIALPFTGAHPMHRDRRFPAHVPPIAESLGLDAIRVVDVINWTDRFARTATPVDVLPRFVYVYRRGNPLTGGRQ